MAHFANVIDGIVTQVVVADQSFIDNLDDSVLWVQTSYNTHGGVHSGGGTPMRKNYAGIGMTYDATRDAFYDPQPYPSWSLNDDSCLWEAPTAMPDGDGFYTWNENTTSWDVVN
tara:strand:+ start:105 stop:446 length:342 start_codon:yes stop_codon:yes gene_type:complete